VSLLALDFRVFACLGIRDDSRVVTISSHELPLSCRDLQVSSRHGRFARLLALFVLGSFLEVLFPFSVSPPWAAALLRPGFSFAQPSFTFGFSRPLGALSALGLLALFHARSALGVSPSEFFSSRAAVRRLRRRCPLVVVRSRNPSPLSRPWLAYAYQVRARRWPCETPPPSGLCSTRESATSCQLFRHGPSAVTLLDFRPPRSSPSSASSNPRPTSPHELPLTAASDHSESPQGLTAEEIGLPLSRLPTLLDFLAS
jgi:hypothetical protein